MPGGQPAVVVAEVGDVRAEHHSVGGGPGAEGEWLQQLHEAPILARRRPGVEPGGVEPGRP